MFEDDEDDDLLGSKINEFERARLEKAKLEFIEGCYEAYDMLVSKGAQVINETPTSEIQTAINRMTQLFLINEEYERCNFLKKYVNEHMPEFEIKPDPSVIRELAM